MGGEGGELPKSLSCNVIRASKVSERSYIESVVDYIHEVVAPQTSPKSDEKEVVLWQTCQCLKNGTIIMFIGYSTGLQTWILPLGGDAYEVFSFRRGPIKAASYLDTPAESYTPELKKIHPFILLVDANNSPTCVDVWSVRSGNKIHTITFKSEIVSLIVNQSIIVVAHKDKIAAFDAITFENKFWVSRCYPCTTLQPIALGNRWLCYADRGAVQSHQSYGGMCGTGMQSYTATVLNAAESVKKGLSIVGETMGRLTQNNYYDQPKSTESEAGVVTIVDCFKAEGEACLTETSVSPATIAHFTAHTGCSIAAVAFDKSGSLLVTADTVGKDFHVFQILPHPWSSSVCQIHHLYILHRGDTSSMVQDLSFSFDSRWVCASTHNGTTHIFPVTPYGGAVNSRTHLANRVVNKHSRFHTTAGINHIAKSNGAVTSDNETIPTYHRHSTVPILPSPVVILPHAQLKQCPPKPSSNNVTTIPSYPIATAFNKSRVKSHSKSRTSAETLFVLGPGAVLVEYWLEPKVQSGAVPTPDTPVQLSAIPRVQWSLGRSQRSEEVQLPFPEVNLLTPDLVEDSAKGYLPEDSSETTGDEAWLSYVEIHTYEAPHRCLWMGPQFCFRTVHELPSALNTASSSILADQTVVSESLQGIENIYDDMELHSTPLKTDPLTMPNSDTINGLCVIESGQGSVDDDSSIQVNMTVESCLKKDDLLLDTINDAMQDVPAKPRSIEDDMAVSQIITIGIDMRDT